MNSPILIVIAGPTASGKTVAAIELAKHYQTVIISADSRQFYREMSVGTAKPTEAELAVAKHYFINSHSINRPVSAGDFEKECLDLLGVLFKTHQYVILVGGSGLFIKAVTEGFDEFPDVKRETRDQLNRELQEKGISYLQEKLKLADPIYYEQADIHNPQRVIRALEVFESIGKPYSRFRTAGINSRPFKVIKLGLTLPREVLYQRINRRVDDMVERGLVTEAEGLILYRNLNALNTVGYSELFDYFEGKTDMDTAIASIKQNTRRFAKRQLTWFRKDKEMNWFQADQKDFIADMIALINCEI